MISVVNMTDTPLTLGEPTGPDDWVPYFQRSGDEWVAMIAVIQTSRVAGTPSQCARVCSLHGTCSRDYGKGAIHRWSCNHGRFT